MDTPILSVVVPIYNVQNYVQKCIESILCQTYKNLQIILVDDGSTDSSNEICRSLAVKDKRISLYQKENGGLSDARNYGIKKAEGRYITFIDSDDYYENDNILSIMMDTMIVDDIDMSIFRFCKYYEDSNNFVEQTKFSKIGNMNLNTFLKSTASSGIFPVSAWAKILRTEIVKNSLFVKDLLSEDVDWFIKICFLCKKIYVTNHIGYVYRQRSGSISKSIRYKNLSDLLFIIESNLEFLEKAEKENKDIMISNLAYELVQVMAAKSKIKNTNERNDIQQRIKNLYWILNYTSNKRVRLVRYAKIFLGESITCYLLRKKMK